MSFNIANFEDVLDSAILQRAKGYYNAGRVSDISYTTPALLHATVDGSTLYDVDIRVKGDRVVSTACTCPYNWSPYCKHIGAVLYAIRDEAKKKSMNQLDCSAETLSEPTYNRVLRHLQNQDSSTIEELPFKPIRKVSARVLPITLGEARKTIKAPIRHFGRRHNPSPYDNDEALQGAYEVIDNAARTHDAVQAIALTFLVAKCTVDFFTTFDDSGGIAADALSVALQLLQELNEEIALTEDEATCLSVYKSIETALHDKTFNGWLLEERFLSACLPLTVYAPIRSTLESALDDAIRSDKSLMRYSLRFEKLRYKVMRLNNDSGITDFVRANSDDPYFLDIIVREAFLAGDYSLVGQLVSEHLESSRLHTWHLTSSDLDRRAFPHGWWTYLEAVYEIESDTSGLLEIYHVYVVNGNQPEYLDQIKKLAPNWEERRSKMVAEFKNRRQPSESFEALLRKEHLSEDALEYCTSHPRRTPNLCSILADTYPNEAKKLLLDIINEKSQHTTGRSTYQEICTIIRRFQQAFGTDEALTAVNDLLHKYPQRRAMKEELSSLKSEWS